MRLTSLLALCTLGLAATLTPAPAEASTPFPGAPTGVRGWCTTVSPTSPVLECFPTPMAACIAQHQGYAPDRTFLGYVDRPSWNTKLCQWPFWLTVAPTITFFDCEPGYRLTAPETCVPEDERFPEIADNNGANPDPETCSPIDILSGAKRFEHLDFALAGGSLSLNRLYSSRGFQSELPIVRHPSLLANSWLFDFQYEIHLQDVWNIIPELSLVTPRGAVHEYRLQADGSTTVTSGNDLPVTSFEVALTSPVPANLGDVDNQQTTWTITDQNDTVWTLQSVSTSTGLYRAAHVTSATMRGGETLTFAYGANDELISMTDGFGNQITFTWLTVDPSGTGTNARYEAIDTATLPDGTVLNYVYDMQPLGGGLEQPDRLIKVERLDGLTVVDSKTYHFEEPGRPTYITGTTGHDGVRHWTVDYDTDGRAIQSTGPNGIDEVTVSYAGDSTTTPSRTITNALGKQAIYRYQRSAVSAYDLRLTEIDGQASANCAASLGTYAYNPTTDFVSSMTDEEGYVTAFVRDGLGRPTQITEASGTTEERITTFTYDATYNQPATITAPGLNQALTYDAAGNLATLTLTDTTSHVVPYSTNGETRTWTYTWSPQGRLLSVDGPLAGTGDTVSYTYDASGFLATTTNALSHVTTVNSVNGRGQPTSITDENGIDTTLAYDALGRIETVTVNPGPNASVTSFTYNALGLITRVTEPNGAWLDYTYDSARRVVLVSNNLNDEIRYTYDDLGGITLEERGTTGNAAVFTRTQTFDELGRLLTRVGAGSRTWTYAYDRLNQLTGITDPRSNTVTHGYDGLRRLVTHIDQSTLTTSYVFNDQDALTSVTDARSIVTSFVRNGFGETIREQSPDIGTIDYVRDARGLVTQRTDARGVVITYAYDNDGRLLSETAPSDPSLTVTYTYDDTTGGNEGIGRVTSIADASGSHAYTYDAQGRLTREQRTIGSASTSVIDYDYDGSGNIIEMIYPSGRVVTFVRDATGAIERVLTQTNASAPVEVVVDFIAYEPFGPLQAIYHGNDLVLWQTFDSDYRLDMLLLENLSPAAILHQRFHVYNDGLNLTRYFDTSGLSGGDHIYNYTPVGRLQNATGSWGDLTFFYDAAGNRTFRILDDGATVDTETLLYSSTDNRLAGIELNGVLDRDFTLDASGNIIAEVRSGTAYSFVHDARGRMASVSSGGTLRATHVYDAFERLAVRTMVNQPVTGTVHYVHDQRGRVIAETDATGQTLREYLWIDDRPVAVVSDVATTPVLYHVHTDHLNRPIAMTDGAKLEVWRANYLPFGAVSSITGSASLDMRFPGQWFQLESGFHHNWHRTYDPTTGRYLQPDPLGMPDGPSRWAYARSAPSMYVDPTGQVVPLAAWAVGAAATAWTGLEIGLSIYDIYSLGNVWLDPCSTGLDRGITTAATAAGIFLPGAGYGGWWDNVVRAAPGSGGGPLWGSWNDYPKVTIGGREYAQIGGRNYTHHAVDRMQPSGLGTPVGADGPGRNVTPNMVESVIAHGTWTTTTVDGVPRTVYTAGDVSVVTENGGNTVVTILRGVSQ